MELCFARASFRALFEQPQTDSVDGFGRFFQAHLALSRAADGGFANQYRISSTQMWWLPVVV